MRNTLLAILFAAGCAVAQQVPIPPFSATSTTPLSRGFWFLAPVNFSITGLRVPDEAGVGTQAVEVIDFGTSAPPSFPAVAAGTQLYYANNQPSSTILNVSIPITAGHVIGVLGGCGTTSLASSFAAAGPFTTSLYGAPITLSRLGTQSNIHVTGGNQPCFSDAPGAIGRVEVYTAPTPGYAYSIGYGKACYDTSRSFYEVFTAPTSFDLANRSMQALFAGDHYVFTSGGAWVPPSANAQTLLLGDDAETSVALASAFPYVGGTTGALAVCSNGFVSASTGNGTGDQPNPSVWLASPQPRWGNVHDYNPTMPGSGQVKFEEVAGIAYITWDGVYDHNVTTSTTGNRLQLQFDTASGNVTYVWQAITGFGNGHLVGYAAGGAVRDLGNFDITAGLAAGAFETGAFDLFGPKLSSARPRLGTTISLDTNDMPTTAFLGALILGLTEFPAGVPLAGLGLPDCSAFTSVDVLVTMFPVAGSASQPLTIPANPSLAQAVVLSQSLVLVPGVNAFGGMVSNGLRLVLNPN